MGKRGEKKQTMMKDVVSGGTQEELVELTRFAYFVTLSDSEGSGDFSLCSEGGKQDVLWRICIQS